MEVIFNKGWFAPTMESGYAGDIYGVSGKYYEANVRPVPVDERLFHMLPGSVDVVVNGSRVRKADLVEEVQAEAVKVVGPAPDKSKFGGTRAFRDAIKKYDKDYMRAVGDLAIKVLERDYGYEPVGKPKPVVAKVEAEDALAMRKAEMRRQDEAFNKVEKAADPEQARKAAIEARMEKARQAKADKRAAAEG